MTYDDHRVDADKRSSAATRAWGGASTSSLSALEVGRINIAGAGGGRRPGGLRGRGRVRAAARGRSANRSPQHQAIQMKLADMGTQLHAGAPDDGGWPPAPQGGGGADGCRSRDGKAVSRVKPRSRSRPSRCASTAGVGLHERSSRSSAITADAAADDHRPRARTRSSAWSSRARAARSLPDLSFRGRADGAGRGSPLQ